MKKNNLKIITYIILIISLILIFFSNFVKVKFGNIDFEQLLYNATDNEGANTNIVYTGVCYVFIRVLLVIASILFTKKILKVKNYFNINFIKKVCTSISALIIVICLSFVSIFKVIKTFNIDSFIISKMQSTEIFEKYYVDARDIKLIFPEKKKNLIYIYLESMEATNFSKENGGLVEKSYIPNLERLALNNVSFSNTDKLGGAHQLSNTNWTMAALISHTAGLPLKLIMGSDVNDKSFPGIYNLGDILYDNGYNNYFIIGSDANFGGRKDYFSQHGNYTIYDYKYAIDNKLIESDYKVWWGYEDQKLFDFSKGKILEAAKQEEPFNFTILTVDTHFTDGYMDEECEEVFDKKYANSIYCSDSKVNSFINWVEKQDFYQNTTIVIVGDHITMQTGLYDDKDFDRTIYNTFINSEVKPINDKNRLFTTLDMFPTTLAAMGIEIEGNRLGLGVNLFSKEKTLVEELGFDYFNSEIQKNSLFYNNILR